MQVTIELNEEKAFDGLSLFLLEQIARETLLVAFPSWNDEHREVTIDVASVSDAEIQRLNKEYREKDTTTDILSFGNYSEPKAAAAETKKQVDLGQLIVSPEYIRRSAEEDGVSWKHEFVYVFSHGILHLLGYDHSPEMFHYQDVVTENIMKNPTVNL